MDGSTTASTSVTVTAVPPEVMVGAITPEASEYIGSGSAGWSNRSYYYGAFAITCGGGSAGDVTVDFSLLDSTATYGVDYTLSCSSATISVASDGLSGTIVMPGDGPTTATIYVIPNDVGQVGGSQAVVMTITSGTGYTAMTGWTATVTINDDDLPSLAAVGLGEPPNRRLHTGRRRDEHHLSGPRKRPCGRLHPRRDFYPRGVGQLDGLCFGYYERDLDILYSGRHGVRRLAGDSRRPVLRLLGSRAGLLSNALRLRHQLRGDNGRNGNDYVGGGVGRRRFHTVQRQCRLQAAANPQQQGEHHRHYTNY